MGYGESKHIAERMLAIAAERRGVNVDVLRLGQVAGPIAPDGGCWNRSEWFPSLVRTSKALGCVPDALMDVDWIPADVLAGIVLDLTHRHHQGFRTFNLVNPHHRAWKTIVPSIRKAIGGEVVSLKEWIGRLKAVDGNDKAEVVEKPALKILDWFEDVEAGLERGMGGLRYATANGTGASATMRGLGPVSEEWVGHWLRALGLGV